MTNLNENDAICAHCGNTFSREYTGTQGYQYFLKTTHCSKSCAVKASKGVDKDSLEKEAVTFIEARGTYCTNTEVCKGIGRSCKTFTQHGVKISELNESLGFTKPKSKFQDRVGEVLSEEFSIVETEKQFDGLVGKTGYPLRVDFFIPEKNMVVEADGLRAGRYHPRSPVQRCHDGSVRRVPEGIRGGRRGGVTPCHAMSRHGTPGNAVQRCIEGRTKGPHW